MKSQWITQRLPINSITEFLCQPWKRERALPRRLPREYHSTAIITSIFFPLIILTLVHLQASPFLCPTPPTSASKAFFGKREATNVDGPSSVLEDTDRLISKLRVSVTFLPLKDLRFARTAMEGHTWFVSFLSETHEQNEAEYLYFPSQASTARILCINGQNTEDGTKNSYALARPEALPDLATLTKGLTIISDAYYDYENLWHGPCAIFPFVGWSIKNGCLRPTRWVLFHWGEVRNKMGSWLEHLMRANFAGEVKIERLEEGDGPYCFEKAVVMRHNQGSMGKERSFKCQTC